jgi:hypothetical protein
VRPACCTATIDAKEIAMIPYDIDPSLHDSEPAPEKLGDGFSPPVHEPHEPHEPQETACEHVEPPQLPAKSLF